MEEEIRFYPEREEMNEGIVTYWHFEEGEEIEESDDLVEIVSNESTINYTAPITGEIIERCVDEGGKVRVGETLAVIKTEE